MTFRSLFTVTVITFGLLVGGCAPRGALGFIEAPDQPENVEEIFVATSRALDETGIYGYERSRAVSFASYNMSIPDTHEPGQLEWPRYEVDPTTDIAVVNQTVFETSGDFRNQLTRATSVPEARNRNGRREVQVFIHGYNTNYAEALYRLAQLKYDFDINAPTILYSWPSAGHPGLYAYDRDSALFARDGLEELLQVLANSRVDKITLIAHSMGSQLLMETLRQIYIGGNSRIRAKIAAVILLSPDTDIDLFNSQVSQINPLPEPFVILASDKDNALRLSSFLAGAPTRVGNNIDATMIENQDILTFNISEYTDGDLLNHFVLATSPSLVALIKRFRDNVDAEISADALLTGQIALTE